MKLYILWRIYGNVMEKIIWIWLNLMINVLTEIFFGEKILTFDCRLDQMENLRYSGSADLIRRQFRNGQML